MRHVQKSSQSLRYARLKINERNSIDIERQIYIYFVLYEWFLHKARVLIMQMLYNL